MSYDRRQGGTRPNSGPPYGQKPPVHMPEQTSQLPADYLKKGYFDTKDNLWAELVCGEQINQVTKALGYKQGQVELKSAQLRRFYGKAKNIEQKLDSDQTFESLRAEILALKPAAANTVARGNAPDAFKDFIDRNIDLAAKDNKHFRKGFLVHFQSIVAYFTYFFRERR